MPPLGSGLVFEVLSACGGAQWLFESVVKSLTGRYVLPFFLVILAADCAAEKSTGKKTQISGTNTKGSTAGVVVTRFGHGGS